MEGFLSPSIIEATKSKANLKANGAIVQQSIQFLESLITEQFRST
jgi:hypothetical protein